MRSAADKRKSRAAAMLALYREGRTLQEIGVRYGLTRERVRQIMNGAFGVTGEHGGRAVRGRRNAAIRLQERNDRARKKFDCSWGEYWDAILIGKKMMRDGLHRERTPRGAFDRQKQSAKHRCIDWQLTFGQWWRAWKESGRFFSRGRTRNSYVMSRLRDQGPYALGNICIITCDDNTRLARINKPNKLRPEEQRGVYLIYPGGSKPYVARIGKKYVGYFKTETEAQEARRIALAA